MTVLRPEELSPEQVDALFQQTIAPRPLAVVSTTGPLGLPHLFVIEWYSSASPFPPIQYFAIDPEAGEGRGGELLDQLRATRDFVLNGVDEQLAPAIPLIEAPREPHASEFRRAGLTALPSVHVGAPRIKESPTHLECRVVDVFPMGNRWVVWGAVLAYHVREDLHRDGKVDQEAYRAVGRIGPGRHCRSSQLYLLTPSLPISEQGLPLDRSQAPA